MSGLYYEVLYAVCCCSVEGFADVVDLLAVTSVYVVDYDIGGEASSYGVIRERSLEIVLNGADGQAAAVVEAGAEAQHEQLVIADAVLVSRVIEGSVAGVVVLVVLCLCGRSGCASFSGSSCLRGGSGGVLCGNALGGGSSGGINGLGSGALGGSCVCRAAGERGSSSENCRKNELR